jgi:hypothetical protein
MGSLQSISWAASESSRLSTLFKGGASRRMAGFRLF